jgi:hypothetical protein
MFRLEALRARQGDCLLLHYGDDNDPKRILIDGGTRGVFGSFLEPRLEALITESGAPLELELLMVSHIDDDHVKGILDLTAKLRQQSQDNVPLSYKVRTLWHNAFDDIVGNHAGALAGAARNGISAASTGDDVPESVRLEHAGALVLANVAQGRQLRDDAATLGLTVNEGNGAPLVSTGDLMDDLHDLGSGLTLRLLGPLQADLDRFQEEWDKEIEKLGVAKAASVRATEYADNSVYNLASLVVLAEREGKTMLLTGDARGDKILEGLRQAGLIEEGGSLHVDLLKLPHHGSDRNVETDFFRRITADHYVISGNGLHGNPELATLQMIFAARGDDPIHLHLTYAPSEMVNSFDEAALESLLERVQARHNVTVSTPPAAQGKDSVVIDL